LNAHSALGTGDSGRFALELNMLVFFAESEELTASVGAVDHAVVALGVEVGEHGGKYKICASAIIRTRESGVV
jgi:hypothetical protein